jgi:hypothetical protein
VEIIAEQGVAIILKNVKKKAGNRVAGLKTTNKTEITLVNHCAEPIHVGKATNNVDMSVKR